MQNDETGVREYLLGRLPEPESEAVETKALSDEDFYLNMRSIEDDLFDEFARDTLNAEDRAAFLRRYGNEAGRLAFARVFAGRRSNVVVFPGRGWIGWAAAAAAVVIVVLSALVMRSPRTAVPPVVAQKQVTPVVRSVAVTIALTGSRSASAATEVIVPNDVTNVELNVRLNDNDRYDRYSMELRTSGAVWHADNLHASLRSGELMLSARVPATALRDGSYELAVRGGGEDLGFVALEVHRTQ